MQKSVAILVGVSGSGKSTLVAQLQQQNDCVIVSADHEHMVDGVYKFDPARIGIAHSNCMNKFIAAVASNTDYIVVDNTNLTNWERQNYVAVAQLAGYRVAFHVFECKTVEQIKLCASRNSHGVPQAVIADMALRYEPTDPNHTVYHEIKE